MLSTLARSITLIFTAALMAACGGAGAGTSAGETTDDGGADSYEVSLDVSTAGGTYEDEEISAYLFDSEGDPVAGLWNATTLDGSGKIQTPLMSIDADGCVTSIPADVPEGSYTLVFTVETDNTTSTLYVPGCGTSSGGWEEFGNEGVYRSVSVTGSAKVVSISESDLMSNTGDSVQVSSAPEDGTGRCYILGSNAEAGSWSEKILEAKIGILNGGVSGGTGSLSGSHLPPGSYKMFCYIDTDLDALPPEAGEPIAANLSISWDATSISVSSWN